MCKTRLKPRWITILTGVAICALVCVYSTSSSWAAMCMVGYNSSACSGNSGVPVPPTSNGDGSDNPNPDIETDCERLGYSERGAKPDSDLWPKIALKNGANDTDKWICDVCQKGGTAVRDKYGYARYNCYLKCQETTTNAATNIYGGEGRIAGWTGVYRDQFVRSQAGCNKLFSPVTGVNGNLVPARKFYWVTRNVCGKCIEQPCDGAAIEKGCYEVCNNKYTLENGTQCCNKLDKLVSLNPDSGDPNYWYPRTSPLYRESGCYTTTRHATAYGDFNNLPDSDPDAFCYHQVKMTCSDSCEEPKEDHDCTCGPKACSTLAEENGLTYSANTDTILENVIYHFSHGDVERVNGTCYQKTPVSNCPSTGCYTLSKLICPNGEPDSDCGCGVGCPYGSIPESEYSSHINYINGKVIKDAEGNEKQYCVALDSDGTTCARWSKCYTYNQCSDLDGGNDYLVPDGSGGCMCGGKDEEGRPWKTKAEGCDRGNAVKEKTYSPPEGNIYEHDMVNTIPAIACYTYDGVICEDVNGTGIDLVGPDSDCKCHCSSDYIEADPSVEEYVFLSAYKPDCMIRSYISWPGYTPKDSDYYELTCGRFDVVECDSYSSKGVLVKDGCDCKCGNGWTDEDREIDSNTETKDSKTGSYTNTDGESVTLTCYKYESKSCGSGEVLTDEGCRSCSDYTDEQSSNSCGCGKKVVDTVEHMYQGVPVLTCYKCGNDDPKTCEDAGYLSSNTTPIPNGDNEWWCEIESISDCVAWENGSKVSCYKGTQTNSQIASSAGYGVCPQLPGYTTEPCPSGQVEVNNCYLGCREKWQCISYVCPRFTESTCSGEFALSNVSTCKKENQGFCIIDGKYYKTQDDVTDGIGLDERDDI